MKERPPRPPKFGGRKCKNVCHVSQSLWGGRETRHAIYYFLPPNLGGGGGLLLLLLLLTAQITHAQTPPAPDTQAFALGLCLQMPTAKSEAFLEDVRGLRGTDESQLPDAVGKLAADARTLRQSEWTAYTEAFALLTRLNAPVPLTRWAQGTMHLLTAPVIPSADVDKGKDSPDTALVLSVIDEAQAVKLNADANSQSLQAWLKLSRGGAGVWAHTLGRMTAGMTVAVRTGRPFLLPRAAVLRLHDTAPPGTPRVVAQTLANLAPRGRGNLSRFVSPLSQSVPADTVKTPAQTFTTAFSADALAGRL